MSNFVASFIGHLEYIGLLSCAHSSKWWLIYYQKITYVNITTNTMTYKKSLIVGELLATSFIF